MCQQIEPAETPASTTPACQACRKISSRPCSRHSASRLATLPPLTQITSCSRTNDAMSATFGMVKSRSGATVTPAARPASVNCASNQAWSPPAVLTRQTRGARPLTPARSIAYISSGPKPKKFRWAGRRPPDVARMVGASAVMCRR